MNAEENQALDDILNKNRTGPNPKEHSMSCGFPEGCSCGASEWNDLLARYHKLARILLVLIPALQVVEQATISGGYGHGAPTWEAKRSAEALRTIIAQWKP